MPDLDLIVDGAPTRVFALLHAAEPLVLDFAATLDAPRGSAQVRFVQATYDRKWELPALGEVASPTAVLVRPDGHVAWVGDGDDEGLLDALDRWFGSR